MKETKECKIVSCDYINELEYVVDILQHHPSLKEIVNQYAIDRLEDLYLKIRTDEIKIIKDI